MYAIVDIETTGGHASANGITEVAVFLHDGFGITGKFQTLVNPGMPIPRYVASLTGITDEMVAGAPAFDQVAEHLFNLLQGKIFVAHNVNFDYSFLRHHLKLAGFELQEKKLCTVRLSRQVFTGLPSYSLGNLCRSLEIDVHNRHRAEGDARATVTLFEKILMQGGREVVEKMLKRSSGDQWLPLHLDKSQVDALPRGPGVYYFKDRKDKVIYVGKAVDIRKRVAGHFTHNDPDPKRQHLLRQVHAVGFRECASELHALILESAEIRKLWPPLNRSQKRPEKKYGLYSFIDSAGYLRLAIEQKKKHMPAHYSFNLLHEGQVMLRKLVDNFSLSRALCFLPPDPSFIEKKVHPLHYNKRVHKALASLTEQLPTFAVVDKLPESNKRLYMLVEKGVFWGMGYVDETISVQSSEELKSYIDPFPDNDFIRSSIYNYAELNPQCKVMLA